MILSYIYWNISPVIFTAGGFAPRWYGILFALGLFLAYLTMKRFYRLEGKSPEEVDILTVYIIIGIIVGARLGHCLFYNPDYYLSNPIEIIKFWQGGLASHGAAVGVPIAIYLFSRRKGASSFLWIMDRIVIVTCLAGVFIRLGNLFNSEILGIQTSLPWGFVFASVDNIPRHPAQLYEAIFYLIAFLGLMRVYMSSKNKNFDGKILGLFFMIIFSFRFMIEFLKEHQSDFLPMGAVTMGQILSIPFIIAGIILYVKATKEKKLKSA